MRACRGFNVRMRLLCMVWSMVHAYRRQSRDTRRWCKRSVCSGTHRRRSLGGERLHHHYIGRFCNLSFCCTLYLCRQFDLPAAFASTQFCSYVLLGKQDVSENSNRIAEGD